MEKKIIITIDTAGKLNVSGPLQDKIFMLGVLEMAKEAVLKFSPKVSLATPLGFPVGKPSA